MLNRELSPGSHCHGRAHPRGAARWAVGVLGFRPTAIIQYGVEPSTPLRTRRRRAFQHEVQGPAQEGQGTPPLKLCKEWPWLGSEVGHGKCGFLGTVRLPQLQHRMPLNAMIPSRLGLKLASE